MARSMFAYTKHVLESVSFDLQLFKKELKKAMTMLLPYELEQLKAWLSSFVQQHPQLTPCLPLLNK